MPSKISSFGCKHGMMGGDVTVFDVRHFYNPWTHAAMRKKSGLDPVVATMIRDKTPNFDQHFDELLSKVKKVHGKVGIMCMGGHHRSVFLAEYLGFTLGVPVEHRDIEK